MKESLSCAHTIRFGSNSLQRCILLQSPEVITTATTTDQIAVEDKSTIESTVSVEEAPSTELVTVVDKSGEDDHIVIS